MKFTKIHSLGNDFLIVEEGKMRGIEDKPAFARQICERHTGAGADGLLMIRIMDKAKGQVNFRVFNADGTEAEISGNGLRCAAAYLYHSKKMIGMCAGKNGKENIIPQIQHIVFVE